MKEKILNSIRVSVPNWRDETAFAELLDLLCEYRDCVQQVAFFSSAFHPPLPLETARAHTEILRDRIRRTKEKGFSCGVNVLSTIGHHPERMGEVLQGDWQRMTNIDGKTNEAVFCPADKRYLEEYVKPLYRIFCSAEPDFVWVDDDLRYGHIPIGNGCFCSGCIRKFNADNGYDFTSETLKAALIAAGNTALRKRWLRHQSEKLADLLGEIGRTVRAYTDNIALGFMTGERYFEGYDFGLMANALSENGKYEIMWRPGGGAYSDRPFAGQIAKSEEIGRQVARLPVCVTSVQSEIENFPYRLLQKSPRSTALEVLLHVSAGCTGAALNVLPDAPAGEPVSVMRGHFNALRQAVPFEKLLSETLGRAPTAGVFDGWHPLAQAALDADFFTGSGGRFTWPWAELFSLGFPRCYDFEGASCYLLNGSSPLAYTEQELLHMLSTGVYMDAEALITLNAMGYRHLTGFSVGDTFAEDSVEIYADHPLNAGITGKRRLCPQVFVQGGSRVLLCDPGARSLCYLTDHRGRIKADCSMGVFENELGGRVCVSSHYALCGFLDTLKSGQMKRLFRFLSRDSLPALAGSCARLTLTARDTPNGPAAVLLNANFDTLQNVSVLFGSCSKLRFVAEDCVPRVLAAAGTDGNMTRFILPPLAPYSMALLFHESEN